MKLNSIKLSTINKRLMFSIGVFLIFVGIAGFTYFLNDVWKDYKSNSKQVSELLKFKIEKPNELKIAIKKRNESIIEISVLSFIFILTGIGIYSYFVISKKLDDSIKMLGTIFDSNNIDLNIKKNEQETISELIKYYLKVVFESHRLQDNNFIINSLPDPEDIISPVRVEQGTNIIYLKWISFTSVLLGLIGTMLSLVWTISSVIESINIDTTNIIFGFKNSLEPLKFAFYCSVAGVYSGFTLNLFRILAESKEDSHYAEIEKKLRIYITKLYAKFGFEPVENKMLSAANNMNKISEKIQGVTDKISKNTTEIIKTLKDDIVKTFGDNMDNLTKGMTSLFEEKFTKVINYFSENINKNLTEKISEEAKHLWGAIETSKNEVANNIKTLENINKSYLSNFEEIKGNINDLYQKASDITGDLKNVFGNTEKFINELESTSKEMGKLITEINGSTSRAKEILEISKKTNESISDLDRHIKDIVSRIKNLSDPMKDLTELHNRIEALKDVKFEEIAGSFNKLNEVMKKFDIKQDQFEEFKKLLENIRELTNLFTSELVAINNMLERVNNISSSIRSGE